MVYVKMMNRVNTYPICRSPLWRSTRRGFVTEIAPKSPFLCVNGCPVRCGLRATARKLSGMVWTQRRAAVPRARLLLEALQVSFVKLRIMFCLFSYIRSASQDVVQQTWWTLTRKFLTLPIILIVIAYNRANLYMNCWGWYHHALMLV